MLSGVDAEGYSWARSEDGCIDVRSLVNTARPSIYVVLGYKGIGANVGFGQRYVWPVGHALSERPTLADVEALYTAIDNGTAKELPRGSLISTSVQSSPA